MTRQRWFLSTSLSAALASMVLACVGVMGSRENTKKKVQGADILSSLWVLARPRLLPFVLLLPLVGFGWGHWDRALSLRGLPALAWVLAAWAMLQIGPLWLNATLDRDLGEVLLGRPVTPPPGASVCGCAALALAAVLAYGGGVLAGSACTLCVVLSIFYSHPAAAWKGRPLLGPLVNFVGYGLLSPLAGWSAVGTAVTPRTVIVWLLGALGILGCYFAAQAFQGDEDRARTIALLPPRTARPRPSWRRGSASASASWAAAPWRLSAGCRGSA